MSEIINIEQGTQQGGDQVRRVFLSVSLEIG